MDNKRHAPIAVFAYKRTRHLARALDALESCPEFSSSRVFVFSDGPKEANSDSDVLEVRAMVRARLRPNMTLIEAPTNQGLAQSIIRGVTELCREFGSAIVIEDDLILSRCALTWLNKGLEHFASDENVWQVSAHQYDVPELRHSQHGVLAHLSTSWGWATWERAWKMFDPQAAGWEAALDDRTVRHEFDLGRIYPFSEMLQRQMRGEIDSWATRWWWAMFRYGALTLFPPRSLISNIGLDETATHSSFGKLKRLVVAGQSYAVNEVVCPQLPTAGEKIETNDEQIRRALSKMWWATSTLARLRGRL